MCSPREGEGDEHDQPRLLETLLGVLVLRREEFGAEAIDTGMTWHATP